MIILTDKDLDYRVITELPKQMSEFESLVRLKSHPPFLVLYSGIESKVAHGIFNRAAETEGEVYIKFDAGKNIPWWARHYATKIDLSPILVLERINKLKNLLEGTLNYVDILAYALEAPMEELVFNCAELGLSARAVVSGLSENMRRKFIACDVLEKYLKERGELTL